MQTKRTNISATQVTLTISADEAYLRPIKERTLRRLGQKVSTPGFRAGKAPLNIVEKSLNQNTLQSEFLEDAINQMYIEAAQEEQLRAVNRPEVNLKKFVPFTDLEFDAEVEVAGDITLADYKKLKKTKQEVKVTPKDIEEVLDSLKTRMAEKKDVDRAAKDGDQVWIDFTGKDTKGEPVKGADGKDYPLVLGSKTFIPGFEENLVGLKAGEDKSFELTFPKDYGMKALANQKVTFDVTTTKVQEVVEPKLDDDFAKKAGPFKNLDALKEDIKMQIAQEREYQAQRQLEDELIKEITGKSKVAVPKSLIEDQVQRMVAELKQNLTYRGQTWQEFLESEGKKEAEYLKTELEPSAEERVKAGLVLSEIAEQEQLDVTPEELDIRIQLLKGQYKDQAMQAELDKPENRRDIAARMLTEKTVQKLVDYATGSTSTKK